jgi:hypothetical protein
MTLSQTQKRVIFSLVLTALIGGGIALGVILSRGKAIKKLKTSIPTLSPTTPPTTPPTTVPVATKNPYIGKCVLQDNAWRNAHNCFTAFVTDPCLKYTTGASCESYASQGCHVCKWTGQTVTESKNCQCRARKYNVDKTSPNYGSIGTAPNPKNKYSNVYSCPKNIYPGLASGQTGCLTQTDEFCQNEDTMTPLGCEELPTPGMSGNGMGKWGYKVCKPCEWVRKE